MSVKYIKKWLSEFRSLPNSAHARYSETLKFNKELADELYQLFNDLTPDQMCQLLDPVCHQLFNCYKSGIPALRNFALEFVPTILWSYFTLLASSSPQSGGIAAFLLGVYNLGSSDTGSNLPSIFQGSIYHEPPFFSTALLTESALKNRNNGNVPCLETPPKKFDSITSQNRCDILKFAVKMYISNISLMSFRSHKALCFLCSRLSKIGFEEILGDTSSISDERFPSIPEDNAEKQRVSFGTPLIIEILAGMHFLMSNGLSKLVLQAIHDAHFRACYDIHPEVLVMTNALLGSINIENIASKESHVGFSGTLNRFQMHPTFKKDAITNASFRAKKLPDDIEVRDANEQSLQSDVSLMSDSFEETHQSQEIEKSPFGKANKILSKTNPKKEKSSKVQKFKENELSGGNSVKKLPLVPSNHDLQMPDGIQLKSVRQNSQDYSNNISEVNFKQKSAKLPYSGLDSKSQVAFNNSLVPISSNVNSSKGSFEIYENSVDQISSNHLLSQSTFL